MIRIAIVDDDEIILNQVYQMVVKLFPENVKIDKFTRSSDFLENEEINKHDVIFLDIDMPKINGFELAGYLNVINSDIKIIFVSNLEHLVFQSFKFKPFRFVRKSKIQNDITSAINDYQSEMRKVSDISYFQTAELKISILTSDIMYFESMGHEIYVQTINDKIKLKRDHINEITMKTLTIKYTQKGFIRIHKSFLVNYKYIYKINRKDIVLKDGSNISINPHKMNEIKNTYQNFLMMED